MQPLRLWLLSPGIRKERPVTSQIDPTIPIFGTPTTASVRNNFLIAKNEITALQNLVGGAGGGSFAVPVTVNGSGTVTLQSSANYYIFVQNLTGAPVTVGVTAGLALGQQVIVKDIGGNAGTYNITVSVPNDVDGNTTYLLLSNYASLSMIWTGSSWGSF
jgi:hypothetical protein